MSDTILGDWTSATLSMDTTSYGQGEGPSPASCRALHSPPNGGIEPGASDSYTAPTTRRTRIRVDHGANGTFSARSVYSVLVFCFSYFLWKAKAFMLWGFLVFALGGFPSHEAAHALPKCPSYQEETYAKKYR